MLINITIINIFIFFSTYPQFYKEKLDASEYNCFIVSFRLKVPHSGKFSQNTSNNFVLFINWSQLEN